MNSMVLPIAVATVVLLVALTEIAAATAPLLIVIILVPPEERGELAVLLAACNSSHRLRLWSALRVAVKARRWSRRGLQAPTGP